MLVISPELFQSSTKSKEREAVLSKSLSLIITDEEIVIPAPTETGDFLYLTYIFVQNSIASSPSILTLQDGLDADNPTRFWELLCREQGAGISQEFNPNQGISWTANKPLVAKPNPAQKHSIAIAYKVLKADGSPRTSNETTVTAPKLASIADKVLTQNGQVYTITPVNNGGTQEVVFTANGLPSGWAIDSTTGVISTTLSQVLNTFTISITATNSVGDSTRSFTVTVTAPSNSAPILSTIPNQTFVANGNIFSISPTNVGGTQGVTYSFNPSPIGWSMSASTGTLSGSLTIASVVRTTITATNAQGSSSQVANISFKPQPRVPNPYDLLKAGSRVLAVGGGESDLEALGNVTPEAGFVWPTHSYFWNNAVGDWKIINPANGYRNKTTPTVYYALQFEADNPNLDLYIIESASEDSGFRSGTGKFAPGGSAYTTFMSTLNNAVANIQASSHRWYYTCFYWVQGKSDTSATDSANYKAQLASFVSEVKIKIGVPSAEILPVRLNSSQPGAGVSTVRTAHETIGNYFLNVDDPAVYTFSGENNHYLPYGYRNIGLGLYDLSRKISFQEIFGSQYVPPAPTKPTSNGQLQNFAGLFGIPAGWSLSEGAGIRQQNDFSVLYRSTGLSAAVGLYYIESPILDWSKPVYVEFQQNRPTISIGVGSTGDWFQVKDRPVYNVSTSNKFYSGGRTKRSDTAPFLNDTKYKVTFTRSGNDLTIKTEQWNGSSYQPHDSELFTNVNLTDSILFIDTQGTAEANIYVAAQAINPVYDAFAATNKTKVIRAWGQSNLFGTTANGTYSGPEPVRTKFMHEPTGQLRLMTVANGFPDRFSSLRQLALALESRYLSNFIFVVDGEGGTGFNSNGGWNSGDALRTRFMNLQQNSVSTLTAAFPGGWEEIGSIGIQGENDANGTEALANAYQAKVEDLQAELETKVKVPNLSHYMVRLNNSSVLPHKNIIREAHKNTSDVLIDVDSCQMIGATDNWLHYTPDGYKCMGAKLRAAIRTVAPISVTPSSKRFTDNFNRENTAAGTLGNDWIQYYQYNNNPGLYINANQAVGTALEYPRAVRPMSAALKNQWSRITIPSQTWAGEPAFNLYCRYEHPSHNGYVLTVRPGRATPGARVGVHKGVFQTDTLTSSKGTDFAAAYTPFNIPWDKAKSYILQMSTITTANGVEIKCEGYEKSTANLLFRFTDVDTTPALQELLGVAGFSYYKQSGVGSSTILKFDDFESHELIAGQSMPAYTL